MTESLELIEKRLLPEGCHFSDEQQAVIFEDDSMDVGCCWSWVGENNSFNCPY